MQDTIEQSEQTAFEQFKLTVKQDQFIFGPQMFAGYGGGVGNGKSFAGCIKTFNHCQDNPGAFFLVGRRHATDLRDSTLKDFLDLFGDEGTYKEKTNTFVFPNGSEVIFRHLDDLRSLTNMNLSGFWIDQAEEVPEDSFIFLVGRIRRVKGLKGGTINRREGFVTFNMEGHNWIWRRFKKRLNTDGSPLANPDAYFLEEATSLENPHLPDDYKERLLSMPKEWIDRFVYGSWEDFAGQIFSEWRPPFHVIRSFQIPNWWERGRTIDHGQRNATACLWWAVSPEGDIFFYQEYYEEGMAVSGHTKNIKQQSLIGMTNGEKIPDQYSYTLIDPSTHAKNREKDGRIFSVADEYLDAGIDTLPAQNDVLAGINRVKEYLKIDPNKLHPQLTSEDGQPLRGAPRLYVFDRCVKTIEEMSQYKWKPTRYGNEETPVEKPLKKDDHTVDCVRYTVMSRPESPSMGKPIDPRIFSNTLEMARYAQANGMTIQDLISMRFDGHLANKSAVKHSESGIVHREAGISHSDRTETEPY